MGRRTAMILAAGLGTRLRPHSLARPKPLFPVLGRPQLLWVIAQVRAAGFSRVVVNAHHLHQQVEDLLAPLEGVRVSVEPVILGTGGCLAQARHLLGPEPFLLVNSDIVHAIDADALYRFHLSHDRPATLALHHHPRFNKVGVEDGCITGFSLAPGQADEVLAFTGVHVLDPEVADMARPGEKQSIITMYEDLIRRGAGPAAWRVDGTYWRDMGTKADYLDLHADLLVRGLGPEHLRRAAADGPLLIHPGARVAAEVNFTDWAVVGEGAKIGQGAKISRSVIWDGAGVAPGAEVRDAVVTEPLNTAPGGAQNL